MNQEELIAAMIKEDLIEKSRALKLEREARQSQKPISIYLSGGLAPEDEVI